MFSFWKSLIKKNPGLGSLLHIFKSFEKARLLGFFFELQLNPEAYMKDLSVWTETYFPKPTLKLRSPVYFVF